MTKQAHDHNHQGCCHDEVPEATTTMDSKAEALSPEAIIAEKDAQIAELKDQWLRSLAEFDNFRKRTQKDLDDARKFAATNFARDMVDVLENLARAQGSITAEQCEGNALLKTLHEGVSMTYNNLLSSFARQQVERIEPLGAPFDPNFHQAVARKETTEIPTNSVTAVLNAGYSLHGRLLRPAMVEVAVAPTAKTE